MCRGERIFPYFMYLILENKVKQIPAIHSLTVM